MKTGNASQLLIILMEFLVTTGNTLELLTILIDFLVKKGHALQLLTILIRFLENSLQISIINYIHRDFGENRNVFHLLF